MTTIVRMFEFVSAFALAVTIGHAVTAEEHHKAKAGVKPVETGVVIRGVTLPGPIGAPGTSTGKTCEFSGEPVDPSGRMEGASVNCRPNGNLGNTLPGLPARFNAYCMIKAPVKSARLIQAPRSENANHCDLSGITRKDATGQFGGAVWR
ncbi:protein rhiC [Rhizobium calliandrae]|uniref:Protein rhiC n=1 Tax=Rhizobium calliandrae TaxID=1312182 RepID=A0ABT7KQ27_9HYPH|nr:protein rhiC [Rhizobium calliandrae]MDL2410736.1 protein rhiC [Rhizobium calliandrae]